jgi:hypothetical protein
MTFSWTTSWIISDKSKNQGISEKPLKRRNFPHTFFLLCLWRFELRYLDKRWGKLLTYFDIFMKVPIYLFSQPILKMFKLNTHQMKIFEIIIFLAFFTENLAKLHLKFVAQCPILNKLKRTFIVWSNLNCLIPNVRYIGHQKELDSE